MNIILETRRVTKIFGGLIAVNKVDLLFQKDRLQVLLDQMVLEKRHCSTAFPGFINQNLVRFYLMENQSRGC